MIVILLIIKIIINVKLCELCPLYTLYDVRMCYVPSIRNQLNGCIVEIYCLMWSAPPTTGGSEVKIIEVEKIILDTLPIPTKKGFVEQITVKLIFVKIIFWMFQYSFSHFYNDQMILKAGSIYKFKYLHQASNSELSNGHEKCSFF